MNMQALMKQAQAMQKEVQNTKTEVDNTVFEASSSFVSVKVKGTKEIVEIKINEEVKDVIADDISMLEDMIMIAVNEAFTKVDAMLEEKMGKYSNMMNGLI